MSNNKFYFALREDIKDDLRFLPIKSEDLSTGYDVRAAQEDKKPLIIKPFEYFKIPLGFRSFCPDGWYYQLHPRSSSFVKKSMHNLIGIVDESWEGYTLFAGQYIPNRGDEIELTIEYGDKIGQIIPVKRKEIKVVNTSNEEIEKMFEKRNAKRRDGGFGSTGN